MASPVFHIMLLALTLSLKEHSTNMEEQQVVETKIGTEASRLLG